MGPITKAPFKRLKGFDVFLDRPGWTRLLTEPNEIDVSQVDREASGLAEDKNWIDTVAGISEQQHTAERAEIPKRLGNDADARPFSCDPLQDEAHRE